MMTLRGNLSGMGREMAAKRIGFVELAVTLFSVALPSVAADWKVAPSTLTTPWTAKVNPDHALPDYPRPQMERKQWANLNGLWEYAIQDKDGQQPRTFTGHILVPFPIESSLSGVKQAVTPEQRLWYRRSFRAPKSRNGHVLLH